MIKQLIWHTVPIFPPDSTYDFKITQNYFKIASSVETFLTILKDRSFFEIICLERIAFQKCLKQMIYQVIHHMVDCNRFFKDFSYDLASDFSFVISPYYEKL